MYQLCDERSESGTSLALATGKKKLDTFIH